MRIGGRNIIITEKPITQLEGKVDILLNISTKDYEEVFEREVGIIEQTEGLSDIIREEALKNKKIIITENGGLNTDYIIHLTYVSTKKNKLNGMSAYYVIDLAVYISLIESLSLRNSKSIAIPLIGEEETLGMSIAATLNAINRFFKKYPHSSLERVILTNSEGLDKAVEVAEFLMRNGEDIKQGFESKADELYLKVKEKESTIGIEGLGLKFLTFGSDEDKGYEETQGNEAHGNEAHGNEGYVKGTKFLTSKEIEELVGEVKDSNNKDKKEHKNKEEVKDKHKLLKRELKRKGISEEEIDSIVEQIDNNDSNIQEVFVVNNKNKSKEKSTEKPIKVSKKRGIEKEILDYILKVATENDNVKIEIDKKGKIVIKIEVE